MKGDTLFSAALLVTHALTLGALLFQGSSQPERRGGAVWGPGPFQQVPLARSTSPDLTSSVTDVHRWSRKQALPSNVGF